MSAATPINVAVLGFGMSATGPSLALAPPSPHLPTH